MIDELKPCPFCGNKDVQMILGIDHCEIWCHECKASISNKLTEHFDTLAEAREALEKSTTEAWNRRADAVEVVRCKDCKYNIIEEWEDGLFLYGCEHPMGLEDVDAYYFCCHGERKENESV